MTVEEAVRARLLAIPGVSALVGTRVYLQILPQHPPLPAIVVQVVGDDYDMHLRGGTNARRARVQIDAYDRETGADPYGTVSEIADAIAGDGAGSGLWGWTGASESPATLRITAAALVDRDAHYEAGELRLVRMRQDFLIWWAL